MEPLTAALAAVIACVAPGALVARLRTMVTV